MNLTEAPVLKYAGLAVALYYSLRFVKFAKQLLKESLWSKTIDFKKFGDWAIVTGASDGIGKAISTELAKCGMNVVLIARTRSKVEKVAQELEENYGIQTKALTIDFSDDDHIYDIIKDEIKDLKIALLLNNVAIIHDAGPLLDIPNTEKVSTDIFRVNVLGTIKMTQLVLPQMVRRRGGIITNVTTAVGRRVFPYLGLYTLTKNCVNNFTTSLRGEYSKTGVIFQILAPGMVATHGTKLTPTSAVPSAGRFGRYAIKALGKSDYTNTSFWAHNMLQFVVPFFPESVFKGMVKNKT